MSNGLSAVAVRVAQGAILMLVLGCVISGLSACGKKARPKPPQDIAPAAVGAFTAEGSVEGVRLFWNPPQATVNGGELIDLAGFIVWRSLVEENGERSEFERIAEIPSEPQAAASETVQRYSHLDSDVKPGEKYDYYVSAFNLEEEDGRPSSLLRVTYIGESSVVVGRSQQ